MAVRPLIEQVLRRWAQWPGLQLCWSPLFRTEPVGGPPDQPPYLNAALLARWSGAIDAAAIDPLELLQALQRIEARFGRQRQVRWGARTLDLDLLWCGGCGIQSPELCLPHPRLLERSFVLAPLAAIDPRLIPTPRAEDEPLSSAERLAVLLPQLPEAPPERLPPHPGWPE